jgi:hypothetical protein
MINIARSRTQEPNEKLKEVSRKRKEDNIGWLKRNLRIADDHTAIVLLGGRSLLDFRLRVAQSHLRHDMTPSQWSHALLLGDLGSELPSVAEIALDPIGGFGFPAGSNGVQIGDLERYRDQDLYPNIALLDIAVPPAAVNTALDQFRTRRSSLDALELIIRWLSFGWGVGNSGNPLLEGYGIPSAAMLEVTLGAAGYDLTPGLESRSSCPEAIWQAAKWWHLYYADENREGPAGVFTTGHVLGG